jgi:hypothetical protein
MTVPILGSSTTGYYWGSGKTALSTDTNSQTVYHHYQDSLDRPTNTTLPNGGATTNSYPSNTTVNTTSTIAGSTNLQTSGPLAPQASADFSHRRNAPKTLNEDLAEIETDVKNECRPCLRLHRLLTGLVNFRPKIFRCSLESIGAETCEHVLPEH